MDAKKKLPKVLQPLVREPLSDSTHFPQHAWLSHWVRHRHFVLIVWQQGKWWLWTKKPGNGYALPSPTAETWDQIQVASAREIAGRIADLVLAEEVVHYDHMPR